MGEETAGPALILPGAIWGRKEFSLLFRRSPLRFFAVRVIDTSCHSTRSHTVCVDEGKQTARRVPGGGKKD